SVRPQPPPRLRGRRSSRPPRRSWGRSSSTRTAGRSTSSRWSAFAAIELTAASSRPSRDADPTVHGEWRSPMSTYLINHLRIPHGIPKGEALTYLEQVESTFEPYGGRWLVLGSHDEVLEGAWPGSVVLMEFPDMEAAKQWYRSAEYQEILHLRTDNVVSD